MTQTRELQEVFENLRSFIWYHVVYLPPGTPSLETECIVLDPNDVDSDQDLPSDAASLGFVEGLGIDDIRSIQSNAQLQGKLPSKHEMLQALVYYLENDAFIDFAVLPER
jgi:hypothetical protein